MRGDLSFDIVLRRRLGSTWPHVFSLHWKHELYGKFVLASQKFIYRACKFTASMEFDHDTFKHVYFYLNVLMCLLISPLASQNAAISGENVQFQCTVLLNVINKSTFLTLVNCPLWGFCFHLFQLCVTVPVLHLGLSFRKLAI